MERSKLKLKNETTPVLSLFLKWYLCPTTLEKNGKIRGLLVAMDEREGVEREKCLNSLRFHLSGEALVAMKALLERPLEMGEVFGLIERIEKFLQLYALGFKEGNPVR